MSISRREEQTTKVTTGGLSRVPTSSGNHGKPGKSLKKSSMHGKIMEFEKAE